MSEDDVRDDITPQGATGDRPAGPGLPPEFEDLYLGHPEFFVNENHIPVGITSGGEPVQNHQRYNRD